MRLHQGDRRCWERISTHDIITEASIYKSIMTLRCRTWNQSASDAYTRMLSIHLRQDTVTTQFMCYFSKTNLAQFARMRNILRLKKSHAPLSIQTRTSQSVQSSVCHVDVGLTLTSERRTPQESKTSPVVSDRRLT